MYQHNGKQRCTEGNSGQHEMRSDQVKSLLPGSQQSFGCGLITRRSQVQILPPPLQKDQVFPRGSPGLSTFTASVIDSFGRIVETGHGRSLATGIGSHRPGSEQGRKRGQNRRSRMGRLIGREADPFGVNPKISRHMCDRLCPAGHARTVVRPLLRPIGPLTVSVVGRSLHVVRSVGCGRRRGRTFRPRVRRG